MGDQDDAIIDAPLTMDDDDDNFDQKLSDSADVVMRMKQEIQMSTPPQSPCPCPPSPTNSMLLKGAAISPLTDFTRRRSKSVDDQDLNGSAHLESVEKDLIRFDFDIRRAMPLPEHTHDTKEIEEVIHDETLTPLVVNRQLYRAHRKMRLAVLEASKRFEDQQMERAKAELQAEQQRKDESSSRFGAGLVMRRGHKKEVSSETIRSLMMQREKQHQTVINDAVRKSGRGKRARKKTVSDMSGMMSAIAPEELQKQVKTNADSSKPFDLRSPNITRASSENQPELLLHDITKPEPTVPG